MLTKYQIHLLLLFLVIKKLREVNLSSTLNKEIRKLRLSLKIGKLNPDFSKPRKPVTFFTDVIPWGGERGESKGECQRTVSNLGHLVYLGSWQECNLTRSILCIKIIYLYCLKLILNYNMYILNEKSASGVP